MLFADVVKGFVAAVLKNGPSNTSPGGEVA